MSSSRVPNTYCVAWLGQPLSSPYGYRPSLAAGIAFVAVFGLSSLLHTAQAIKARRWWQFTFVLGATAELVGWIGRLISYSCPYQSTPFLIQISTLIFAPAFTSAGVYYILGALIKTNFGRECSPLGPNLYLYIFFTIDTISLVIQAVGGGLAASAINSPFSTIAKKGTDAMVAGIVFQLAATLVFTTLFCYVLFQAKKRSMPGLSDPRAKAIIAGTAFSVLCIVIRGIYRTVEMLQGWNGNLMRNEIYFIVLDGVLMSLSLIIFNLVNPGWSQGATTWASRSFTRPVGIRPVETPEIKPLGEAPLVETK